MSIREVELIEELKAYCFKLEAENARLHKRMADAEGQEPVAYVNWRGIYNNAGRGGVHGSMSWNHPSPKEPPIPEGFTRHDGGECLVHPDTVVSVLFYGGTMLDAVSGNLYWSKITNDSGRGDIIAYKVIKPATVMVELTREDAWAVDQYGFTPSLEIWTIVRHAIKTALSKEQ